MYSRGDIPVTDRNTRWNVACELKPDSSAMPEIVSRSVSGVSNRD